MSFHPVAFIDASQATASYVKQFRARLQGDRLALRLGGVDNPILKEWKSAKILLNKIASAAAPLLGGEPAKIVNAMIWSLPPQGRMDWMDAPETLRAYLPLLPSPGAMLFSGLEAHNPPVGQLTAVGGAVPFAALNLGPVAAVWLQIDAEFPDRETGPAAG